MSFDGQALTAMSSDDYFIAPALRPGGLHGDKTTSGNDPGAAVASVSKVFFPHDIHVRNRRRGLSFRHSSATLSNVTFNQITYGDEVDIIINGLNRSHYIFVLPLRGVMAVETKAGSYRLDVGNCMLMSPDAPYAFSHSEDDSHLAVGIPRRMIEIGEGLCQSRLLHGIDPEAIGGGTQAIIEYLSFLCGEFNRGGGLLHSRAVSAHAENMLVSMVQTMVASDVRSAGTQAAAVPGFVYRAERYIANHLLEDISLADIVAASGVPMRTLYHGFRQFRCSTPAKTLRAQRLELIRREIQREAGNGVQVTDIAYKYWMSHPGRFAAYYRAQFKESPSATLKNARARILQESCDGQRRLLAC